MRRGNQPPAGGRRRRGAAHLQAGLRALQEPAHLGPARPRRVGAGPLGRRRRAPHRRPEGGRHRRLHPEQPRRPSRSRLTVAKRNVGRVEITGDPTGAEVLVNGRLVGKVPLPQPVRVIAGSVDIELRAPGYRAGLSHHHRRRPPVPAGRHPPRARRARRAAPPSPAARPPVASAGGPAPAGATRRPRRSAPHGALAQGDDRRGRRRRGVERWASAGYGIWRLQRPGRRASTSEIASRPRTGRSWLPPAPATPAAPSSRPRTRTPGPWPSSASRRLAPWASPPSCCT